MSSRLQPGSISLLLDGQLQALSGFRELGCHTGGDRSGADPSAAAASHALVLDSTVFLPNIQNARGKLMFESDSADAKRVAIDTLAESSVRMSFAAYAWDFRIHPVERPAVDLAEKNVKSYLAGALNSFDRPLIISLSKSVLIGAVDALVARSGLLEVLSNQISIGAPRRKDIVWFCSDIGGTPFGPYRDSRAFDAWVLALHALQRSNTAVYTVDCFRESATGGSIAKLIGKEPVPAGTRRKVEGRWQIMSEMTGGRYYSGMPLLGSAVHQALQDADCAYEISLQRQDDSRKGRTQLKNAVRGDGEEPDYRGLVHSMEVRTADPNVELLYPQTYVEVDLATSEAKRLKAVETAFTYRLPINAVPVEASLRGEGNKRMATVSIGLENLTFKHDRGVWKGLIDMVWGFYDAEGRRVPGGQHSAVRLNVKDENLAQFRAKKQQTVEQEILLPESASQARVVARDAYSGAMGSAEPALK